MPYKVGKKGSNGCSGFPAMKDDGTVMGCHATAKEAAGQIFAINRSEGNIGKAMVAMGDFVIASCDDEIYIGRVEHVMSEGYVGLEGSEYYMEATAENPAVVVRTLEFDSEGQYWEETSYLINVAANEVVKIEPLAMEVEMVEKVDGCCPEEVPVEKACWDGYAQRGMKPKDGKMVPNCVPVSKVDDLFEDSDDVVYESDSMEKADGYSAPAGAASAARRAIKFKEDGKANGAGTSVGWTRAGQLARGETLSLSTVKRMYSYFSRHEVDKKGKDWGNTANPSNGYIMWLAWGGDAGFSWSRGIVQREMDKSLFSNFGRDYTKSQGMPDIFKGTGVGSMVSWNSSGGTAEGKITRIIRNGSYKVPGTEITVSGTPEDPAAVIRLYRDGKPTDTIVAHKVKTLRSK